MADLPRWKDEALAAAQVPGATTLCVTADVTGLPHIARWAFVTVTGRAFDAIINPRPVPARRVADRIRKTGWHRG